MENIKKSSSIKSSNNIYSSRNIESSRNIYSSDDVDSSRYVYSSCFVDSSRDIMFCHDIKFKEFYAFNKQVTEDRYNEIKNYWNEIKGNFKLEFKDNNWEDGWKKIPNEVWIKLSELPEFDKEVVEQIIGFELDFDSKKTIEIGGIKYDKEEVEDRLKDIKPIN